VKGATTLCVVIKAVLIWDAGFSVGKQGGEITIFVHESDCDHVVLLLSLSMAAVTSYPDLCYVISRPMLALHCNGAVLTEIMTERLVCD
jgi:hypothetical protein